MTNPRCPCCDSPDFVPYKFPDSLIGDVIKHYYPNARKCMDCDASFYDYEAQTRGAIDLAKLTLIK